MSRRRDRRTASTTASASSNYRCDITYGQNNEFGFDYLRDNMKVVARAHTSSASCNYAIVDEVDSILIDEARTPLIIRGPAEAVGRHVPARSTRIIPRLRKDSDYTVDEKAHSAMLTDDGVERDREAARRRQPVRPGEHRVAAPPEPGLRAHTLYKRDVNYMVEDGKVLIIDEFTGRMMPGRRWSRRPAPGGRGQGEASRSRKRTRRWRPSRSRTTSACTRSWPA